MFFYSDGNNNIEKHTLINVQNIITSQTEKNVINKVLQINIYRKNTKKMDKIVGTQRIALFVSNDVDDIQNLAKYIQTSLNKPLSSKDYIHGILINL